MTFSQPNCPFKKFEIPILFFLSLRGDLDEASHQRFQEKLIEFTINYLDFLGLSSLLLKFKLSLVN